MEADIWHAGRGEWNPRVGRDKLCVDKYCRFMGVDVVELAESQIRSKQLTTLIQQATTTTTTTIDPTSASALIATAIPPAKKPSGGPHRVP